MGVIIVLAIEIFKAIKEEQTRHQRNEHYKVILLKNAYGNAFKIIWLDSIGIIFRTDNKGSMVGSPIKFNKYCVDRSTNSIDFFYMKDDGFYKNVLTIYGSHFKLYWSDFL